MIVRSTRIFIPYFRKSLSLLLLVSLSTVLTFSHPQFAYAGQLTGLSDTLSNPSAGALSNHTIVFTTPTGITAGQTVQITFTGYANLGQIASSSIDVLVGNSTTTASQVNVGNSNGASQWGVATSSNVLTLTAPSSGSLPSAGQVVEILIGTNATNQWQGFQQITNPSAGSYQFTVGGTQADSGSITVTIVSNATVSVTATVTQSISFAILSSTSTAFSNQIYFGALNSASAKFASSTNVNGDTVSTVAHTLAVSTNAPTGYTITLQGDTLRNQNATTTTIAAIGATAASSAAGSAQFGINVTASGGVGTQIKATYGSASKYGYNATLTTSDLLAFGDQPTTTTTYSLTYLANIPATQAAGTYTTAITYVGTANF